MFLGGSGIARLLRSSYRSKKGDLAVKYIIDHDYHIHSGLSLCSGDSSQTPRAILDYAVSNNYRQVCITDHFWDETVPGASNWYKVQDFAHISAVLPLPQGEHTRFLFGCETDFDKNLTLGVSREHFDRFDFVIVPINHLHMEGFTIDSADADSLERRAYLWTRRLDAFLDMDIPFEKTGIAHITDGLTAPRQWDDHLKVFSMIEQSTLEMLFDKAAERKVGIELNLNFDSYSAEEREIIGRVYFTAKRKGCKFYFGSDAHHPAKFQTAPANFRKIADWLELEESDKFIPKTD